MSVSGRRATPVDIKGESDDLDARALEKLHKVNYYVPHVHLMRIKEGRIKKNPAAEVDVLVDFAFLPLHFIPNVAGPRRLKITMLPPADVSPGCTLADKEGEPEGKGPKLSGVTRIDYNVKRLINSMSGLIGIFLA